MINVGVIGSGSIVNVFVGAINLLKKDFHLVGIWGRHTEKLKNFEKDFDYYTTDLNKLLNDSKIDVVYVALPNGLHYEYSMKVLKANKNVFLEKPFTVRYKETKKLIDYANKHNLFCLEAIVLRYNPIYPKVRNEIKNIGKIKMIDGNFSQYSRRYDKFKQGIIMPVFNYKLAGGALLDLNVYNIHYVTKIFGKPKKVNYFPNIERKVDTSGVLILDYGTFKATLIAAKDCKTQPHIIIQGDEGYIKCNSAAGVCDDIDVVLNNGKTKKYNVEDGSEFAAFVCELKGLKNMIKKKDKKLLEEYNNDTLVVAKVMDDALVSANINY